MEDLRRYLIDIVEPTIADFASNRTSARHAFLACVATFHCVDYLAHPKPSGNLRKDWNIECPAFGLVDDIAHAFKHVETGKPKNLQASEVVTKHGAFDAASFDTSFDVGSVTLENEPSVDVLAVVKEVADFIRKQLDPA
jgi:hypothetical protein